MVLDLGNRPAQPDGMMCPHCHVALSMSSREGIEIDYCPKCRGVWLDRGELDKIIERSQPDMPPSRIQTAPPPEPAGRYDDDDRDDKRRRKYRKKSWLAEIFDELT